MPDSITVSAECDSLREKLRAANVRIEEFEKAATDYPPSENPTKPDHASLATNQAWIRAKNATSLLDAVIEHLRGKVDGLAVSVDHLQGAHEEVMESLASINVMLCEQGKILQTINRKLSLTANEGRNNSERLSLIELSLSLPSSPNRIGIG